MYLNGTLNKQDSTQHCQSNMTGDQSQYVVSRTLDQEWGCPRNLSAEGSACEKLFYSALHLCWVEFPLAQWLTFSQTNPGFYVSAVLVC